MGATGSVKRTISQYFYYSRPESKIQMVNVYFLIAFFSFNNSWVLGLVPDHKVAHKMCGK